MGVQNPLGAPIVVVSLCGDPNHSGAVVVVFLLGLVTSSGSDPVVVVVLGAWVIQTVPGVMLLQ